MRLTIDQYAKLIYEADKMTEGNKKKTLLKGVVDLIKKNRDFKKFNRIEVRYKAIKKKESGLLEGVVYTKIKLGEDQFTEIRRAIAKEKDISEKLLELENSVDLGLKGGFIVKLENEIFDGSLDNKIRKVKEALSK